MNDPRKILILLGLICQGFTWDNYFMPVLYAAVWFFCVKWSREKPLLSKDVELIIFFGALTLCILFGSGNLFSKAVFIGNSLFILQAILLLRPINGREKMLSTAIAITQLAIGSQIILNYGYILILIGAVILIPKTLRDLESGRMNDFEVYPARALGKYDALIILVAMLIFFLAFPRWKVSTNRAMRSIVNIGPMKPELETSSGGGEIPDKLIFQIEGENINYLKSYALDTFDGNNWKASYLSYSKQRKFTREIKKGEVLRKIMVRDVKLLGLSLPSDGYVTGINGNFFQDAYVSLQGNVVVSMTWNAGDNFYEYWTFPKKSSRISKRERERCLSIPKKDPAIERFISNIIKNEKNKIAQANLLESFLKNNFKYVKGAPSLNRLSPLKDFLLDKKEGHCERFASALALLLRMQGIPSRVAVGYYPLSRNNIGDFCNVRTTDGHAWTEAYFDGKSWVTMDATPYSDGAASSASTFLLSLYDWVEFYWYSKIINFSVNDQKALLVSCSSALKNIFHSIKTVIAAGVFIVVIIVLFSIFRKLPRGFKKKSKVDNHEAQVEEAKHFYGQLLKELSKWNFFRKPHETPYEFLIKLQAANFKFYSEAEYVTEIFCRVKYGNFELNREMKKRIEEAISEIEKNKGVN
jgi:hypothetical protein